MQKNVGYALIGSIMAAIQDVDLECRIILVRNAKCEFIAR